MNLELVVTFQNQAVVNFLHLQVRHQQDLYLINQEHKLLVIREQIHQIPNML